MAQSSSESVRVDAIRLQREDYVDLAEMAEARALPLRTLARSLLTQAIREEVEEQ